MDWIVFVAENVSVSLSMRYRVPELFKFSLDDI